MHKINFIDLPSTFETPAPFSSPSMTSNSRTIRSLYRRILRELPTRSTASPTNLANPSPIQRGIRSSLSAELSAEAIPSRLQEAEQFVQYVKAQRMYATLIERYNPGMNMHEEDRVRLTARRVGMNLPVEMGSGTD